MNPRFASPMVKQVAIATCALFVAMSAWAFSAPIGEGATPDERFHIGSIWCANGIDEDSCLDFLIPDNRGYYLAVAKFDDGSCFLDNPADVVRCKTPKVESYPANFDLYPSSYYRIMNLLVTSHPTLSVLAMRLMNGLIAVSLFAGVLLLAKRRERMAWLTGYIFTILPMTMFLTASVHPSGWAVTGVSTSWLFLQNAIIQFREKSKIRFWPVALWAFASLLVFASRYDAFMFLLFSNFVVLVIEFKIFQRMRYRYMAVATVIVMLSLYLTSRVNGMVAWIFNFPLSQPDGWTKTSTWISHWMIQTIWVPLQALGLESLSQSYATGQATKLPDLVWIFGIVILGTAMLISAIKTSTQQILLLVASYFLLAFVILSFNGRLDRDLFKLSGRYVLPIFSFIVSYSVYLSKSPFQLIEIRRLRTTLISLLSIVHALSLYSLVETNVDGQSFSVEPIHVEINDWWWAGLPIGPNFLVILGSLAFVWFLIHSLSMVESMELDLPITENNS